MKVNFQKILLKFAYLFEGGSVLGSPPNTGLMGKFCVCFRQNVATWHNFLRIFDIWTFLQYFADILTTCTTKHWMFFNLIGQYDCNTFQECLSLQQGMVVSFQNEIKSKTLGYQQKTQHLLNWQDIQSWGLLIGNWWLCLLFFSCFV